MKCYKLSILRHGQTRANEEGFYIGKTDLPLSEAGREELEEKYRSCEYPKVERVYSSPAERALQSAEILFPDREIIIADDLREMDFGVFEGVKAVEAANLDSYKKWLKGGLDNPPPNGESLRSVIVRCYSAMNAIIRDMMQNGIARGGIMTHSGIMMNILSCFGLPKLDPMEFTAAPGEGFEISVTSMLWQNGGTFEIVGKIPGGGAVGFTDSGEALFSYGGEEEDYGQ